MKSGIGSPSPSQIRVSKILSILSVTQKLIFYSSCIVDKLETMNLISTILLNGTTVNEERIAERKRNDSKKERVIHEVMKFGNVNKLIDALINALLCLYHGLLQHEVFKPGQPDVPSEVFLCICGVQNTSWRICLYYIVQFK